MTRKSVLICLVAALGVVALPAVAGGTQGPAAMAELANEIRDQAGATADAMALANSPWVPRTAGLGAGLAVGLLGGGLAAYVTRGGSG